MPLPTNSVVTGDCFDVIEDYPAESIHSVVTDPPYALGDGGFMGREWDNFSDSKTYQKWCEAWAAECLRVLKPGGHLLAFGGNTRHHRLFSGVEDAGFEVRDTLTYHYGSGFPKALDVSKAIDKAAGAEREVVGDKFDQPGYISDGQSPESNTYEGGVSGELNNSPQKALVTAPATDAAREWDGFKTALKPATEFIVLARKPFSGTVAENVQAHGTGALNIDGCRIGTDEDTSRPPSEMDDESKYGDFDGPIGGQGHEAGRYPANVIFDAEAAEQLDREVGETSSGDYRPAGSSDRDAEMFDPADGWNEHNMDPDAKSAPDNYGGSGGPSRYFYTSKATRAERTLDGRIENDHPTVKPQDLMEWLVKLVTAEDQIVLDPFAGTGTTAAACKALNRRFIAIEMDDRYADIARVRAGLTPEDPSIVRDDDGQHGLEAFPGDDD